MSGSQQYLQESVIISVSRQVQSVRTQPVHDSMLHVCDLFVREGAPVHHAHGKRC